MTFSYQSLMPAVAGTPRYENGTWSLEVFGCGWCHPSPLDSRFRENDELGGDSTGATYPGSESGTCFRANRSCRLVAGTPRYENGTWSLEVFGCAFSRATPLPQRGIPASALE